MGVVLEGFSVNSQGTVNGNSQVWNLNISNTKNLAVSSVAKNIH